MVENQINNGETIEKKEDIFTYSTTLRDANTVYDQALNEALNLLQMLPYFKNIPRDNLMEEAQRFVQNVYVGFGSKQEYSKEEQKSRLKVAETIIKIINKSGAKLKTEMQNVLEVEKGIKELKQSYSNSFGAFDYFFDQEQKKEINNKKHS